MTKKQSLHIIKHMVWQQKHRMDDNDGAYTASDMLAALLVAVQAIEEQKTASHANTLAIGSQVRFIGIDALQGKEGVVMQLKDDHWMYVAVDGYEVVADGDKDLELVVPLVIPAWAKPCTYGEFVVNEPSWFTSRYYAIKTDSRTYLYYYGDDRDTGLLRKVDSIPDTTPGYTPRF